MDAASGFALRTRNANIRSRVDAWTAEVVRELRADRVRAVLLKGPVLSSLLYGEDGRRVYVDSDLLVGTAEYAPAERCLRRIGFRQLLAASDVPGSDVAGHPWIRSTDAAAVDLHWTLPGVRADPAAVWEALSGSTRAITVAGLDVEAPSVAACALIVALHCAHHGRTADRPLEDLTRALERLDSETWAAAARLAERFQATPAFTGGLMLDPAGERLARDLRLPTQLPLGLRLKAGNPPAGAVSLHVLASTSGARAKARLVARKAVPTRRFMRVWFPRSALGARWMLAGYLWRLVWLALRAGPALLAWRASRRD
jgi:hypothetical protein